MDKRFPGFETFVFGSFLHLNGDIFCICEKLVMPIVRSQSAIVRPNQEMLAGPTEKGHFFNIKYQRNVFSIKPEFDNRLFI